VLGQVYGVQSFFGIPDIYSATVYLRPVDERQWHLWLDPGESSNPLDTDGRLRRQFRAPAPVQAEVRLRNARGRMRRLRPDPIDLTNALDGDVITVPVDPQALATALEELKDG
jgi:hypothetical protein